MSKLFKRLSRQVTIKLPVGALDAIGNLPLQEECRVKIREVFSEFPWLPVIARAEISITKGFREKTMEIHSLQACEGSAAKEALLRWLIYEAYKAHTITCIKAGTGIIPTELLWKYRFKATDEGWLVLNMNNSWDTVKLITDYWSNGGSTYEGDYQEACKSTG